MMMHWFLQLVLSLLQLLLYCTIGTSFHWSIRQVSRHYPQQQQQQRQQKQPKYHLESTHKRYFPKQLLQKQQSSFQTSLASSSSSSGNSDTKDTASSSNRDEMDKIVYQRAFYSFTPGSDVDIHKSIIIEERVRFQPIPQPQQQSDSSTTPTTILQPIGPVTLVLRDGNVQDGEIGNDFCTIHVDNNNNNNNNAGSSTTNTKRSSSHNGIGTLETTIATALYLASNPTLIRGTVMEIGCEYGGLGSILGSIGAAYVLGDFCTKDGKDTSTDESEENDIENLFTISSSNRRRDTVIPEVLELLTLTDETFLRDDSNRLELTQKYCTMAGLKYNVRIEPLEWRTYRRPSSGTSTATTWNGNRRRSTMLREYNTIIASDLAYSYPESKELARTVANQLMSSSRIYDTTSATTTKTTGSSSSSWNNRPDRKSRRSIPTFVHICPEYRSDVTYLRNFLQKGYRMTTTSRYLKLEQLKFKLQTLFLPDATATAMSKTFEEETALLDDMELELINVKEVQYQCLESQHHPDYAGAGTGELFFPMETGEYDATGGSTFLERETGSSPW